MAAVVWAALFTWLGMALAVTRPADRRLRELRLAASPNVRTGIRARLGETDLMTSPWIAAGCAAMVAVQFVPGWLAIPAALGAGAGAYHWVAGLETIADRRRRERVGRDLPSALDLIVASLAAGRPPSHALQAVADAVGGPIGADLHAIAARIDLGADPLRVWRDVAAESALGPLGRAFARAEQSGASTTVVLARCVDDLRRRRAAEAQRIARGVGVKAAAPLGACFLPAFIAVGIVPTIVGAFEAFVI